MINAAIRLGIYEELKNSLLPNPPRGKKLEDYIELASNYDTRGEFKNAHPGAYAVIRSKDGWAEKCFAHMKYVCRPELDNQNILKSASLHSSISAWKKDDPGAYYAARRKDIFAEATKHMTRPTNHNKKSDTFYIEISRQYNILKDFKTDCPNEYAAICRRGKDFQVLCLGHMKRVKHYYTKEQALFIAKEYSGRTTLYKGNSSVYHYLRKHKLLDIAFPKKQIINPIIHISNGKT